MSATDSGTSAASNCRSCGHPLRHSFLDLGKSPLCESYLDSNALNDVEAFYPLHALICEECFLVQLKEYVSPQNIFGDYAYFSSYSDSWVEHARTYARKVTKQFNLGPGSLAVELASNDGYLLQHFVELGIPCFGVEPAANIAKVARGRGISTEIAFFSKQLAEQLVQRGHRPQLIVGNNVLAHVPDLNDFIAGMKVLLHPDGVITMEFPHLLQLMRHNQFDTIYHEHFCYFSLAVVEQACDRHGLTLFDVEELSTHGGSLRIFACHKGNHSHPTTARLKRLKALEKSEGLLDLNTYKDFSARVTATKRRLLQFLIDARNSGRKVVGYGAPGKGNTLLNYCGIRTDFLDYTVDRSPHKQGLFTPGTHIPIEHPDKIFETRPDYVLILPWNLADEIMSQMAGIRKWGGRFVIPIPEVAVI